MALLGGDGSRRILGDGFSCQAREAMEETLSVSGLEAREDGRPHRCMGEGDEVFLSSAVDMGRIGHMRGL